MSAKKLQEAETRTSVQMTAPLQLGNSYSSDAASRSPRWQAKPAEQTLGGYDPVLPWTFNSRVTNASQMASKPNLPEAPVVCQN